MANLQPAQIPEISLLWPPKADRSTFALSAAVIRDLELESCLTAICPSEYHRQILRQVFFRLCVDPDTITYRQAVLKDLLDNPQLGEVIQNLLPDLDELALFSYRQYNDKTTLHEVTYRLGELKLLIDCITTLKTAFTGLAKPLESDGLLALQTWVSAYSSTDSFRQLEADLPEILSALRSSASLTIGVNLDQYLRPVEAVLLSVNQEPFHNATFLERVLGTQVGLAPLHTLPLVSSHSGMIAGGMPLGGPPKRVEPMLVPLFRDLADVLEKTATPLARRLREYIGLNSRPLVNLHQELVFYRYAAGFTTRLRRRGLSFCRPEIAPFSEHAGNIQGVWNLYLGLHLDQAQPETELGSVIVPSDAPFTRQARIAILTGPNQGGKTTFLQALGLAQVLAQAGLFIPGFSARISPVDGIYTHFPLEERLERGTGRFGDEARRLREIFEHLTGDSLVLLNESLASTSTGESLFLAQDLVRILDQVGVRAVYSTHLHQLAASIPELDPDSNRETEILSLVASGGAEDAAGPESIDPDGSGTRLPYSYRILLQPPQGRSYADRIAAQHGIAYPQLVDHLRQRGILPR